MEKKTATQVQQQIGAKAHLVANYVAKIMADINQETPLSYEQANSVAQVLASPVRVLINELERLKHEPSSIKVVELQQRVESLELDKSMLIDRLTLVSTQEMTPDYFTKGKKVLAWNGYFFEAEWDGEDWCSLGGDDFDFFMSLPSEPLQKGKNQ